MQYDLGHLNSRVAPRDLRRAVIFVPSRGARVPLSDRIEESGTPQAATRDARLSSRPWG